MQPARCIYRLCLQFTSLGLSRQTPYLCTDSFLPRHHILTPEDLRAAVAAGILTEAQAASLSALANDRAGKRATLPSEDEPFEFFRGFSEIFISIGLVILLSGATALLTVIGGFFVLTLVPLATAAIAWWWATYFTLKRRMTLPSMVLAAAYGTGIVVFVFTSLAQTQIDDRLIAIAGFGLSALAALGSLLVLLAIRNVRGLGWRAVTTLAAAAALVAVGGWIFFS